MQPPFQPPPNPNAPYPPSAFQPPAEPAYRMPPHRAGTPGAVQRSVSVMDALRFPTSGSNGWNNLLLCSLLFLSTQIIPVLGQIVAMGFFAEIHRRLVLQHPEPYVRFDFSDTGSYLSRGVIPFVMYLALTLPFVIFFFVVGVGAGILVSSSAIAGLPADDDTAMAIGFGIASLLFLPLGIFWLALANAATTRAELTGDFGKAFNLGGIWSLAGKTWGRVLVTTIVMGFFALGITILGLLACVLGVFVSIGFLYTANLHIRWQIYNDFLLKGGEPIELAPFEPLPSEATRPVYAAPPMR